MKTTKMSITRIREASREPMVNVTAKAIHEMLRVSRKRNITINDSKKENSIQPVALIGGLLAIFAQAYLWGNVFVTLFKPQRRQAEDATAGSVAGNVPQGSLDRPLAPEQLAPEARRLPPEHRLVPDDEAARNLPPSGRAQEISVPQHGNVLANGERASAPNASTASSAHATLPQSSNTRFSGASGQPWGPVLRS